MAEKAASVNRNAVPLSEPGTQKIADPQIPHLPQLQ
jgi:hypothetical protein